MNVRLFKLIKKAEMYLSTIRLWAVKLSTLWRIEILDSRTLITLVTVDSENIGDGWLVALLMKNYRHSLMFKNMAGTQICFDKYTLKNISFQFFKVGKGR